jgi:hypothetical protein
MLAALGKVYKQPEYFLIGGVPNATGFRASRTADAIAIGLWPSRGIDVHGFEMKASNTDLAKELNTPAKADTFCKHCDYWWLVLDEAVTTPLDKIPAGWGVYRVKSPEPGKYTIKLERKASKIEHDHGGEMLHRTFFVSLVAQVLKVWQPAIDVERLKRQLSEDARAAYIDKEKGYLKKIGDMEQKHRSMVEPLLHAVGLSYYDLECIKWNKSKLEQLSQARNVLSEQALIKSRLQHDIDAAKHLAGELERLKELWEKNDADQRNAVQAGECAPDASGSLREQIADVGEPL